jgi:hypothetical protein
MNTRQQETAVDDACKVSSVSSGRAQDERAFASPRSSSSASGGSELPLGLGLSPAIRRKLDPVAFTDTAKEIGEEKVCANLGLFSAWLDQQDGGEREPSSFGPISTADLVSKVLLNPSATSDQLARAAREMRARYLAENEPEVNRLAMEALQA